MKLWTRGRFTGNRVASAAFAAGLMVLASPVSAAPVTVDHFGIWNLSGVTKTSDFQRWKWGDPFAVEIFSGAVLGGITWEPYANKNYYGGHYYYPGRYYTHEADAAYCAQRFKSYDPRSGTYRGPRGRRHRCP